MQIFVRPDTKGGGGKSRPYHFVLVVVFPLKCELSPNNSGKVGFEK